MSLILDNIEQSDYLNSTIDYYNKNAKYYADLTNNCDMNYAYQEFTKLLSSGSRILDVGCGSGRDLDYFNKVGFEAEGLELSENLCSLLNEKFSYKIFNNDIRIFLPERKYDALWCCASLIHLNITDILNFFKNANTLLNDNGIIYVSAKQNINTGLDSKERYFTNFDNKLVTDIISYNPNLSLIKEWISSDNLKRNEFIWINLIFQFVI